MALCYGDVTYSSSCQLYPQNLPCSKYLGNTYVFGKHLDIFDSTKLNEYNGNLEQILSYLYLVLPHLTCKEYLSVLICHHLYPACFPQSDNNGYSKKQVKRQKLCKKTCNYFYNDLCDGLAGNLGNLFLNYLTINFNKYRDFSSDIGLFLNATCENKMIYDEESHHKECFHEESNGKFNYTCDGNGYRYIGTQNTTTNGSSCLEWSSVCLKHTFINFGNISSADKNYCRNPSGYRERPWCFVANSTSSWEFCDIGKCPVIDGNYDNWSNWSMCSFTCGKDLNGLKSRKRSCVNPKPKYGGSNCTLYGASEEFESCLVQCPENGALKLGPIIIISIVAAFLLCLFLFFLIKYKRKSGKLATQDVTSITPETISAIMHYREEDEVDDNLELVYRNLKDYKNCFCHECIESWLRSLHQLYNGEVNDNYIQRMLNKLNNIDEENGDSLSNSNNDYVTNAISSVNTSKCAGACFFDHNVKQWLQKTVIYDRLPEKYEGVIILPDGLYFHAFSRYDKLHVRRIADNC